MIYDSSNKLQAERAKRRLESLIRNEKVFEINEKTTKTLSQLNYLHLIIGYLAIELGHSMDYVKQVYYKKAANTELFVKGIYDDITSSTYEFVRSTSSLTKDEMSLSIDRFRDFAAQVCNVYLPEPDENRFLNEIRVEIERNKQYL